MILSYDSLTTLKVSQSSLPVTTPWWTFQLACVKVTAESTDAKSTIFKTRSATAVVSLLAGIAKGCPQLLQCFH